MEDFFINPVVRTFLGLGICFAVAGVLIQRLSMLRNMGLPIAILAGFIGFVVRIWFPEVMDVSVLKTMVYHGLALVFMTVGLQVSTSKEKSKDALSLGFAISTMGAFQGIIGAAVVLGLSVLTVEQLHPGLGLLLPLGFNQGPGQALSFGRAWEASGLESGADLGIIIAAMGFLWSILLGVPLVMIGRRKGWVAEETQQYTQTETDNTNPNVSWVHQPDTLVNSIAMVLVTYVLVYLFLSGVTGLLDDKPKLVNMLWGLHFVIALFFAMGVRALVMRDVSDEKVLSHNERLQVLNNLAVDSTTAAGLVAIQIVVFSNYIGIVLLLTTLAGVGSLGLALLIYRRAFQTLPFHHLILWLGACTGTFPMGLSLLRMIDPNLSSSAPSNFTKGAAMALVTSAPLLGILGYAIGQYPAGYPNAGWITLSLLSAYFVILLVAWRTLVWKGNTASA